MKRTLTCPKCSNRKLWILNQDITHLYPNLFPFKYCGWEIFICAGCRYSEWYARDFEKIDYERTSEFEEHFRLVGSDVEAGPYRDQQSPSIHRGGPANLNSSWPAGVDDTPRYPVGTLLVIGGLFLLLILKCMHVV